MNQMKNIKISNPKDIVSTIGYDDELYSIIKLGTFLTNYLPSEIIEFILPIINRGGIATLQEVTIDNVLLLNFDFFTDKIKEGMFSDLYEIKLLLSNRIPKIHSKIAFDLKIKKILNVEVEKAYDWTTINTRKFVSDGFFCEDKSDGNSRGIILRFTSLNDLFDHLHNRMKESLQLLTNLIDNKQEFEALNKSDLYVFLLKSIFYIFNFREYTGVLFTEAINKNLTIFSENELILLFENHQWYNESLYYAKVDNFVNFLSILRSDLSIINEKTKIMEKINIDLIIEICMEYYHTIRSKLTKLKKYTKKNIQIESLIPLCSVIYSQIGIADPYRIVTYLEGLYKFYLSQTETILPEFKHIDNLLSSKPDTTAEIDTWKSTKPEMLRKIQIIAEQNQCTSIYVILQDEKWMGDILAKNYISKTQLVKMSFILKSDAINVDLTFLPGYKELLNKDKIQFKDIPSDLMNTIVFKFQNFSASFEFATIMTFEDDVGQIVNTLSNGQTYIEEKEFLYTKDPFLIKLKELEKIIGA